MTGAARARALAEGRKCLQAQLGRTPRSLLRITPTLALAVVMVASMAATGISRQTIHDYTVSGFIEEEERTPAGHRLYAEWIFERLAKMADLQEQGKSLKEIKQLIDEGKL